MAAGKIDLKALDAATHASHLAHPSGEIGLAVADDLNSVNAQFSRFRSLFVIARNSSFQYRDKAVDVRRVARELGVRYIVEGSVRKMGGRLRTTAQLIDGLTGNHLWSERYDRSSEDLFELQDEVTRTIVARLIGRVEDAEVKATARERTENLAAYDCFLRGLAQCRVFGPDENRIARGLFERALALDPGFALAHAYRALALLADHDHDSAPRDVKERALDIALAAVRLDPHESGCHLC